MEPYGYIYKITTPEQDTYVGQHKCQHFDPSYWGSGVRIVNYIKLHGTKDLTREILDWAYSQEELDHKELQIITDLQPTMNLMKESNSGWYYVNRLIQQGELKHPKGMLGKKAWNKGKTWSEETRKRISESNKKYFETHEGIQKGKPLNEKQRLAIIASNKRRKGEKRTEEQKERMRKNWKNQYTSYVEKNS